MQTYLENLKSSSNIIQQKTTLKHYAFISMVVVLILVACDCLVYKPVKLPFVSNIFPGFGNIAASAIIYPIAYYLIDISTEVYGYELTRKIIHRLIFCNLFFMILTYGVCCLPSPDNWSEQAAFDTIFGRMPTLFLASTLGLTVGAFVNSIVVSKLKILMHGKKYWLRSFISSSFGQLITCIASYIIIFGKFRTPIEIVDLIINSWLYKSAIMLIFWAPNCVIAKWLKKSEGLDHYDFGVKYNIIDFTSFKNKFSKA